MESSSILSSGNFKNLNVNGNSLFNDVNIKGNHSLLGSNIIKQDLTVDGTCTFNDVNIKGNHSLLGSNIIKQDLTVEGTTKLNKLEIYNKTTNEFNNVYLEEDNSNLHLVVKLQDGTTKKITFN